jgi:hypothetical protein
MATVNDSAVVGCDAAAGAKLLADPQGVFAIAGVRVDLELDEHEEAVEAFAVAAPANGLRILRCHAPGGQGGSCLGPH